MYVINMNEKKGYESFIYPDGQPHVRIDSVNIYEDQVRVICSITDSVKLLELCEIADAINRIPRVKTKVLTIPYLMGARFDRVMEPGDSFDLKVIAKIINSLKFDEVELFDVHSDVATALIENSYCVTNEKLVRIYDKEDSILIIPDAGASKKASKYLKWNKNIIDSVQCIKHRDLSNGKITLTVLEPEKCENKHCVIIDDLCDGGATFNMIVSFLRNCNVKFKSTTLIVTHGIFSRGFEQLEKHFDEVIVSDSYPFKGESSIVKLISI